MRIKVHQQKRHRRAHHADAGCVNRKRQHRPGHLGLIHENNLKKRRECPERHDGKSHADRHGRADFLRRARGNPAPDDCSRNHRKKHVPELIRLHAHDVDAPVGGTRNKNALPEKRETQCAAARHEGGVGGGLGVIHGQKLKVHRRTGAFGKALRQKENTGKAQKRTDDGGVNMMKGAIETADKVTTVSPSYAWEILDPWYSHGMDRILRTKQYKLSGILNGIDVNGYDPETDEIIEKNYSARSTVGKKVCKAKLLAELGLQEGNEPVIGIVTRFVSHKGIDLIKYVFEDLIKAGFKFVILGSGEKIYEDFFKEMEWRYKDKVSVSLGFIPELSRKIYSGADMFLMPSQSEPCGLAQMIAMRYGTIPIVRETGGLRDTVRDCGGENGNGFTFKTYNAHDMFDACMRAKAAYEDKRGWNRIIKRDMAEDFSWANSAELYIKLYHELTDK